MIKQKKKNMWIGVAVTVIVACGVFALWTHLGDSGGSDKEAAETTEKQIQATDVLPVSES